MSPVRDENLRNKISALFGATIPLFFIGWWWLIAIPASYWLLIRAIALLPSSSSLAQAKARESEGIFFLSALSGSLKAGLPLLPALSNVMSLLNSSLKRDIEELYSLLLLGADPNQAWSTLGDDEQLGPFARTMAQAQVDGRSLTVVIERAVEDSFAKTITLSKERVKSLSVKLALPVGLCFLPSFLIGGIGPIIYSFFTSLQIF